MNFVRRPSTRMRQGVEVALFVQPIVDTILTYMLSSFTI
jgi:hypothetical protein